MQRLVRALLLASTLAAIASLAVHWFRHEHTLGAVHVRNTLTLLTEEHCSNFARDSFRCETRSLASGNAYGFLYPSFVRGSMFTALAAVLTALAALFTVVAGEGDTGASRAASRVAWSTASSLVIGSLVVLGRMPRDPRVEALSLGPGAFVALASGLGVLAAIVLRTHASGFRLPRSTWVAAVAALVLLGSTMHPAWRQHGGDVGTREVGLTAERFCALRRIGCSWRSYEPVDDRDSRSHASARRLGLWTAHAGATAALVTLLAIGAMIDRRSRTWRGSIAWMAGLACAAYAGLGIMFLGDSSYGAEFKASLGAGLAFTSVAVSVLSLVVLARAAIDAESE